MQMQKKIVKYRNMQNNTLYFGYIDYKKNL